MTAVELVNPLPEALGHYQRELTDLLGTAGVTVTATTTASAERRGTGRSAASVLAESLDARLRVTGPPPGVHRLVLWPVLGYPELLMWRGRARDTSIVFHDPRPLRRQVGLGTGACRLTRVAGNVRCTRGMLVHSAAALVAVEERGFTADLLPHPILAPVAREAGRQTATALVLGQYKEARDLSVLKPLATRLLALGLYPRIVGRGWPSVPGWDVEDRFVSETEFDDLLRSSAVVLLPYTRVYQSGVAVRAAELAVPVVGGRATNLPELYGAAWPGLLAGDDAASGVDAWADAVERVLLVDPDAVWRSVSDCRRSAERAWADWAARVARRR